MKLIRQKIIKLLTNRHSDNQTSHLHEVDELLLIFTAVLLIFLLGCNKVQIGLVSVTQL